MPDLYFDAVPIWNAFQELSASRQSGFGVGYIPFSEVTNWLDENHIASLEDRKHYRKFIGFIDNLWVGHANEKSESSKSKSNNKAGAQNNRRSK